MNRLASIALATILFAFASLAVAQTPAGDALTSTRSEYGAVLAEFESVRSDYETQTAEIEALKAQVAGSPLVAIELQRALRASQGTADRLLSLDGQLSDLSASIDALTGEARAAAVAEIAALEAQLATAAPADRAAIVARLNERTNELAEWSTPLPGYAPVPLEEILAQIVDTPEELLATADELADHADRVASQLEEIERRLAEAEARERLEQRARALALEESFFEDSVSRRPSRPSGDRQSEPTRSGGSNDDETTSPTDDQVNEAGGGRGVAVDMEDVDATAGAAGGESDFGAGAPQPDEAGGATDGPDLTSDGTVLPVGTVETPVPGATLAVDVVQTSLDPTDPSDIRDGDGDRRGRRRGAESDELRARQAQLLQDLGALQSERERLIDRAATLEAEGGLK